eukprot:Nitzschia sp. Nitz4//scaffold91_size79674//28466//29545//NITZ4_005363-RA/size79674-processed-gene-0.91-mRNA-1//1//CDS//3329560088//4503//frame0
MSTATISTSNKNNATPHPSMVEEEEEMNSEDEALLDMLGLSTLEAPIDDEDEATSSNASPWPILSQETLESLLSSLDIASTYQKEGICFFPPELSISAEHMRRLTDELVWGGDQVQVDKTYETVHVRTKDGHILPQRSLTRMEHFVDAHSAWSDLCHDYLRRIVSAALGQDMVLYKEKLNLKPPGGTGFAPHLDTPSLRIALGPQGPQEFCTVMVAIDDMTVANGCLRISKGAWRESHCLETVAPEADGNPDAGGRAGAIPLDLADTVDYVDLVCKGGSIAVFNGWAPHRSSPNQSPFPRRAVFLTYNPKEEGDFHVAYYDKMDAKRREWREKVGLAQREQQVEDAKLEMEALATVPTI